MKTKPELRGQQIRESFLDLLRILACFFVIVNHTVPALFLARSPQERTWFLAVGCFFLSKPAVLIFYMISGYLLLGRQDSWTTAWRRIRRILLVLLLCAVVYGVFHSLTGESEGLLAEILSAYWEPPSNALWYLYTYLGLLILLPYLQKMAAAMDRRDYHILFGLACVFVGTMPILSHYHEKLAVAWPFELPLLSNAVTMLFAGNYFARFGVKKTKAGFALAAVLTMAMVLLSTYATWMEYTIREGQDYLFFDRRELLPNMIGAVCLFYLAGFVRLSPKAEKVVSGIGGCTFGMYLIGDILLTVLLPVQRMLESRCHVLIALAAYQGAVFFGSLVIIALVRRIPWVKKLI